VAGRPGQPYDEDRTWFFFYGWLLGQILLLVVALIVGAALARSQTRRRVGMAVFTGWGVGFLAMPFLAPLVWLNFIHPL